MLWQLRIKNLAVIEDLRLEFGEGLTVLSGDEGAGKSLLVDALCLLAGAKASSGLVRNGASTALVEGVFHVPPDADNLTLVLEESGLSIEADGNLIIAREIQEEGRNVARLNGRAVPVSLLREIGQDLMDIHGQMEHLSLLGSQRQMDLLDGYGGLLPLRSKLAGKVSALRETARELSLISGESPQRERELLEYQVAEIDQANVQPGEDESLKREYGILQRALELKEQCYAACSMLYADEGSAAGLAHQAVRVLRRAMSIDPALESQVEGLESTVAELEETARTLCRYLEAIDDNPKRLQQVEERLDLIRQLKRKYGPTLEDVLRFAGEARAKLASLESQEQRRCQLETERQRLRTEAGELAQSLSLARQEAAHRLAQVVNSELSELGMLWARFDISLTREESSDGLPVYQSAYAFSQHGIDRIQFLASTNPGEPLRPLADIASGGETCRFMLALKSALRQADSIPTLVFDEIDAAVGGRNAHVVGRKLATLARDRQVICITHLPQIACFGDNHYRVVKDVSSTQAITFIEQLEGDCRVQELAAMLGGIRKPMLESAQELLKDAREKHELELIGVSRRGGEW